MDTEQIYRHRYPSPKTYFLYACIHIFFSTVGNGRHLRECTVKITVVIFKVNTYGRGRGIKTLPLP